LNPDYRGSLAPQPVKLVILPLKGGKNMDNNIAKIKKEPAGVNCSFSVARQDAFPLQCMPDLIMDSLNLPLAITTADDKVISKATYLAGIKQHNIRRLLITGRF
jgi:hypothetical protein